MAEWSKALVLGTSLFGGVGSNPTPVTDLWGISSIGRVRRSQRRGTGIETRILHAFASQEPQWRNWIAHQTSNLGVVGSNPTWGALCFAQSSEAMAQWQRVGFQTQRLGVRIPLASCFPN